RPRVPSSARQTSPKPPRPSRATSRYRPASVRPASNPSVIRNPYPQSTLGCADRSQRSTFEGMVVNVFDDEWRQAFERDGYVSRIRPLREALGAERMGATVMELAPGEQSTPYHFQYAEEEWLLVLDGEPTLRTPGGVQTLKRGDIVAFRRGP